MKKKLSNILILFIVLANLFAPICVGLNKNNNIEVKSTRAEAANDTFDATIDGYKKAFPSSSLYQTSTTYIDENRADTVITLKIDTGIPEGTSSFMNWLHVKRTLSAAGTLGSITGAFTWNLVGTTDNYGSFKKEKNLVLKVTEEGTNKTGWIDVTSDLLQNHFDFDGLREKMVNSIQRPLTFQSINSSGANGITSFKPGTKYTIEFYYLSSGDEENGISGGEVIPGLQENGGSYYKIAQTLITTATKEQLVITTGIIDDAKVVPGQALDGTPECSALFWTTVGGCLGQALYYLLFKPTSFIFGLSGKILDFTVMYSIQDTSYRSQFVVEGWALVKDFCNMFFIFVLLYIAFGTILNLSSVKTKEMIINVVIIGLLINFSLFATQVIIDASNILTRVFYNQKTIVTGTAQKDASGNPLPVVSQPGEFGEIKLSEAIVSKVNPQKLITQSQKINAIPVRGVSNANDTDENGISPSGFIIIVLLTTAINVVGIMAFLSIGVIFIARVVGLWLAMIFAPLAFFSYIVPQLQDIEMIGWKKWWPDTLKMAFLAPIFAFFMYLIVGFLDKGLGVLDADSKSGLNFVVAIMVPFIFIMLLLMKAKDIAKKMSGTIGDSITKVGAIAGGLALGAATGGAAMAMRGTVGRLGSAVASSDRLKAMEAKGGIGGFGAKMLLKGGSAAGSGSMDLRGIKIAGKGLSDTGLKNLGTAKEGGFTKARAEKVEKRQKRMKEIEVGEDSKLKQNVYAAQNNLDTIKNGKMQNSNGDTVNRQDEILAQTAAIGGAEKALAASERAIAAAERAVKDAVDSGRDATPERAARDNLINGINGVGGRDGTGGTREKLEAIQAALAAAQGPINAAERLVKNAENAVTGENRQRRQDYSKTIQGGWSQSINMIISGGQHSVRGEREAANKILAGIKDDKK